MAFKKGQSGNPGGRPKDKHLRELCQAEADRCIKTLIALRDGKKVPPAVRRQAAVDILDRGFGKPAQAVAFQNGDGEDLFDPTDMVTLARDLAFALRKGAEESGKDKA